MDRTGHGPDGEFVVSHQPVLLMETVHQLMLQEGGVYVDGTSGEGGHSQAILQADPQVKAVLGIDRDSRSLATAQSRLAGFGGRFLPAPGNYAEMAGLAAERGITEVDGVLLDLGFSSRQVEIPGYGLSFQMDEPLDMRYDPDGDLTAEEIVNTYDERELGQLIRRYGEEPRGMSIARALIKARPVATTGQLASIVGGVLGRRPGQRINPATRTFQALRIAVNDELSNLERGLDAALGLLVAGGRLAVISYHSLEDRTVKSFFNREAATCVCPPGLPVCVCGQTPRLKIINRRVIKPSNEEVQSNPRSRSAKLRVVQRI
ncbi:MAG: 16S rRNA (cytosine(1402)-N(4))-methyltransferase RsmH [Chloroflexi bacterium]|nr:16S rRNA (cytosine(1402)-N(4))-methyltransferase RsmH [Chloroflexota bacterium]